MPRTLGILLISGGHERAHYAWVMAAAAAAIGRPVVLFATNEGCRALLAETDPEPPLPGGVANAAALRDAAVELGVVLLACDAGLRLAGIEPGRLLVGVSVAGVPSFLSAIADGQIVTL